MTTPLDACRKCDAPMDVARHPAAGVASSRALLLDIACGACGHRALYDWGTVPVRAGLNMAGHRR